MDKFQDDSLCIYDFKKLKKNKIKNNEKLYIYKYISKGNKFYNAHPPPTNKLEPRLRGLGMP